MTRMNVYSSMTLLPFEIENRREEIRLEIEKLGAELVDLGVRRSSGRGTLIITADKPGGITLDDCARINGHLSRHLDEFPGDGGFFNAPYYLEVNSPGLDRPFKTEKDFLRAKGQTVRVVFKNENGIGVVRVGELLEVENGSVKLRLVNEEQIISVAMTSISKAVLEIKIGK